MTDSQPHNAARAPHAMLLDGEPVVLHPERALELPRLHTLVVADVHWGKATALRAQGIPVPPGGTTADLHRLSTLLRLTHATRLLVLGDLAHSRHGWEPRALEPVRAWRAAWPELEIMLVRGNHDQHAGDPPAILSILAMEPPFILGPFQCTHEPPELRAATAHAIAARTLCGHVHPNLRLRGRGADRLRLPCFVLGPRALILPAFSTFTGGGAWEPVAGERAFAIVDQHVVEAA